MTNSTITSVGGFHVGDHVRLRDDADPRDRGRIHGVKFSDGVIDRLDSTHGLIRVTGVIRDDSRQSDDCYWYAPDEVLDQAVFRVSMARDLIEPQIDEDTSDGYHTFRQLYYQRMMLFAVLVAEHRDLVWKTLRNEDGKPCFGGGWFLVTIETPNGPYGYHYESKYWDLFDCEEIPKAKHWDGYDESDVGRLMSLVSKRESAENGDR